MTQHCLLICQVCQVSPSQDTVDGLSGGAYLLRRLDALKHSGPPDLLIQAVGCLWSCDRPCSATFVCPGKYTYHFGDLSPFEDGDDLLQFGSCYIQSDTGYVLPARLPEPLKPKLMVRIPPPPSGEELEKPL